MSQAVTASSAIPPGTTAYSGPGASAGGAGTGGTGAGTTFLVPNPPPALSALPAGQVVRAVAAGKSADGTTLLDTRYGQIPVKLPFDAPRGTVLRLEILQNGNPAHLSVVDVETPGTTRTNGSSARADSGANPSPRTGDVVSVRTSASASSPAAASVQAPGAATAFSARIVWLGAPPATATSERTGLIVGRIAASPAAGPTMVQTPSGSLALPAVGGLQVGDEIALRPLGGQPTGPTAPTGGAGPGLTTLGSAWTALEDVHAILTSAGQTGSAAGPLAGSVIPATGPQLASGMLLFLNALFQGNIQEWLGRDVMRLLADNERQGLSRRLADDFAQLSRVAAEPAAGEWRMAVLPLLNNNILQQIRMYVRHLEGNDGPEDASPGTRFVVEASLSHLGALQLDGLVRPSRFDLMVRTHAALPEHMRDDVSALFANANREFRAAGRIDFRVENPFSVNPGVVEDDASGVYA